MEIVKKVMTVEDVETTPPSTKKRKVSTSQEPTETKAANVAEEKLATVANGTNREHTNGNGAAKPEEASPFTWSADAQARLERAPEGFMRDCTKALILKHAEKIGATVITIEVANEGIEQAKSYMADAMKTGNLKDMIADLTGKGRA